MSEVRVYDAPSGLAGKWVRESDVKALRDERDRLREALQGILDIGKRDMTNPKYDGYFEAAEAALAPAGEDGGATK